MIRSRFFILQLLFFVSSALRGQGVDVRGVVSDSATGERIPYANVTILTTPRGASSNIAGFFLIPGVPLGTYELAASAVGYERQVKNVVVQGPDPIVVNFKLNPQAVQKEEIVISGEVKRELSALRTSTHVVDKQDLKMVPMTAQEDILRSLQILPGIVSTSDVNSQFYVRGGAGDQNLILLDGMKIYNPFHAFGLFSIFDPDVVKSAEVYTGAFPAEYGNRLSSTINITTRDGNATDINALSNVNFLSSKITLEAPILENTQWIATARKSMFSDSFRNFLKEDVPLSFYDGMVKFTYKSPDSESKYSARAFLSRDDLRSSNPTDPEYSWSTTAFAFEMSRLFTDRLFLSTVISASSFRQSRLPRDQGVNKASTSVTEFGIRTTATSYTSSGDLFFYGFEFTVPNLEYEFVDRFGSNRRLSSSTPQLSSWVRYQFTVGDIQADAGLRTEFGYLLLGFPVTSVFQPRLSVSYDLADFWKAKLAYAHVGQDAITAGNEEDLIPIFNAWVQVPAAIGAEESNHYVAGIEGNLTPTLSTNLQAYYKTYNPIAAYNRNKLTVNEPLVLGGTGKSYGVELLVRLGTPLLDLYSAYTLSWTRIDLNGLVYPPRYDRRHILNLLGSLHLAQGLDVFVRWEFGSGLPFTQSVGYYDRLLLSDLERDPGINETGESFALYGPKNAARLPPYHRLDAGLFYQLKVFSFLRGSAGISVINVYGRRNIFYFDRSTGQRVDMLGLFPSADLKLEFLP
ncbi:MAG: TonB-dependent receptor [Ignavibacteriales bacterium]|nr:TonB-dependent receptor [Ignavibacteriales bacterium]